MAWKNKEKEREYNRAYYQKNKVKKKAPTLENQELIQAMQETILEQKSGLALMKNVLIENIGLIQKAMQDIVALQKAVKRLPTMNAGLLGHKTTLESIETKISVLEKSLPNYEWVRTFHDTAKVLQDQITRLQKEQDSEPAKKNVNVELLRRHGAEIARIKERITEQEGAAENNNAILKRHDAEVNSVMEYIETVKATMVLSGANDVSLGEDIELLRNRITLLYRQVHVSPDEVDGLKLRMSNHDDKVETLMEIIKVTKRHVSKLLDESGDIAGLKKDVLDLSELTNLHEDKLANHKQIIVENQEAIGDIKVGVSGYIAMSENQRLFIAKSQHEMEALEDRVEKIEKKPWFPFRLRSPIYKKED